jgi:hypothetical protein
MGAMQGLPVHITESPYELTQAEHNGLLENLSCIPSSKDQAHGVFSSTLLRLFFKFALGMNETSMHTSQQLLLSHGTFHSPRLRSLAPTLCMLGSY